MKAKRFLQTISIWTIPSSAKRTEYLKKHNIFDAIGENCSIMDRKVPLYAKLIRIGNNVHIASKVDFITHDITHVVINQAGGGNTVKEKIGCIDIGDNVFIGSNTTVLKNVRIGNNVIVGAGSLVNKDIPDDSVVAGIPAKRIASFSDFVMKRVNEETYPDELRPKCQAVSPELVKWMWSKFDSDRGLEDNEE